MVTRSGALALTALALAGCSKQAEPIRITGSSTVYPFTKAVADRFVATNEGAKAPVIESVGTVAGARTFCAGSGAPDILDASRRMTRDDFARCQSNRAGEVLELAIGLDGVALGEAREGPKLEVTEKDLYLALAATPRGRPNAARTWRDVNPALPPVPIKVLGPPESSGTRDSFVTLLLEPGCIATVPEAAALRNSGDPAKFDALCRRIRTDGPYVAAGEDDEASVRALEQDPRALGLIGYSYLERNAGRLRGVPINGVAPDAGTITRGQYPAARQLYLYVKKAHLERKPAIKTFLTLYTEMARPGGALVQAGLIALSEKSRARTQATLDNGYPLEANDLP